MGTRALYQEAMAVVRMYGASRLFITSERSPDLPDIEKSRPHKSAREREAGCRFARFPYYDRRANGEYLRRKSLREDMGAPLRYRVSETRDPECTHDLHPRRRRIS